MRPEHKLIGLGASVWGILFSFYGFLAWRAFLWSPRFVIRATDTQWRRVHEWVGPEQKISQEETEDESSVVRGKRVYERHYCAACHGVAGKGGVKNRNAQTGGEVPGLRFVAEGFTPAELQEKINVGVQEIAKEDPAGLLPPLAMPSWHDQIQGQDLKDIVSYLISLMPKEKEEEW